MRKLMSCGVIVFRREPVLSFLLLRRTHRFDLPKGHVEPGETEHQCALRELFEETGLDQSVIQLDPEFRFETKYYPRYRQYGGRVVEKTVVLFLGWLLEDRPVTLSEHGHFEWVSWQPPHRLAHGTIDGVLAAVARHFDAKAAAP